MSNTMENKTKTLSSIFCIRPVLKSYLGYSRQGRFKNELPRSLVRIDEEIRSTLSASENGGKEFLLDQLERVDDETTFTPREFLIRLFGLKAEELSAHACDEIPSILEDLIDDAEDAFLLHIDRNNAKKIFDNRDGFKLRMSGIVSKRTNAVGRIPLRKKHAIFTVGEFEAELNAAKVPPFYYRQISEKEPEKILQLYSELPDSVKDLLFSVSWHGQLRNDFPLYLTRDLLLFADNARWEKLKTICEQGDRASAMEAYSEFLREFLTFERQNNGFSLGAARKEKNIDKFSSRELSLLEFCKSAEHISVLWKSSPIAPSFTSGEEK